MVPVGMSPIQAFGRSEAAPAAAFAKGHFSLRGSPLCGYPTRTIIGAAPWALGLEVVGFGLGQLFTGLLAAFGH
jgi:hypothetical protein